MLIFCKCFNMTEMALLTKNRHHGPNILAVRENPCFHGNKVVSMETNLAMFFPCPNPTFLPSLVPFGPINGGVVSGQTRPQTLLKL